MRGRRRFWLGAVTLGGGLVIGVSAFWLFASATQVQADQACTVSWVGPSTGGPWATASNWSPAGPPPNASVVCIGALTGPVVFDGSNGTSDTLISELESSAPLSITGGELGITDTAFPSSVGGFSMSGGQLGDATNTQGSLTDSGAFSWSDGSFHAPPGESPQPVLTQSATASTASITNPFFLDNWGLDLASPLDASGNFYFENGGGITASNSVTLEANTTIISGGSPGPLTITSGGSLTKTNTASPADVQVPVAISGGVSVPDGTLLLDDGGTLDGAVTPAAQATLQIAGTATIEAGASVSGAGTLELSGTVDDLAAIGTANVSETLGTTTVAAPLSLAGTLSISGGEVDLAATGSSVGGFSMSGGQLGDATNTQGSLTDSGAFSWSDGSFHAPPGESPQPVLTQSATASTASITNPFFLDNWGLDLASPLDASGNFYFENGGGITASNSVTLEANTTIISGGSPGPLTITSGGSLTGPTTGKSAAVGVPVVNAGSVSSGGGILTLASLANSGTLDLSTGTVKLSSAYAPSGGSLLEVSIAGSEAGSTYGQLQVTGTAALAGTLVITTDHAFAPSLKETFDITTSTASTTGDFGAVDQSKTSNGLIYSESPTAAGAVLTAITPPVVPGAPTIGIVLAGSTSVSVGFVAPTSDGGSPITSYSVTAADETNPARGGQTASGATGPLTVAGLTNGDSYTFTVTATNQVGTGPASAPSGALTPAAFPTATVKAPYTVTLSASGGATPYAWTLDSGTLPAGLSLSATNGTISGTPTKAGIFPFSVQVTDSSHPALAATMTYSIVVQIAITPGALPVGTVKASYSVTLSASGGTAPYVWTLASGTLPAGLSLSGTKGTISGTPTKAGAFKFTVEVTDAAHLAATMAYSLAVKIAVTPATLPAATVKSAFSVTLSASGGTAPYAWKLASGALPAGLSLSGTKGTISGTPTKAGTFKFTVQVTDAKLLTGTMTYSLVVKIAITPVALPAATLKVAYSVTLSANGGTSPYSWKLASGSLPAGLSLSATKGVISGTPTKAGTFVFTVEVTDSSHPALTATRTYTLVVKA